MKMEDILLILAICTVGFVIFLVYAYGAIYKPMKDTLEHDRKIDNEPVPDGIVAREQ